MASLEKQVDDTERAFKRLSVRGQEWLSLDQLALQARIDAREQRRHQRSRVANSVIDLLALGGRPSRPSFRYRHQTELAIIAMKAEGTVERRFMDEQGRLRKDPPLPRSAKDARYRLVPETDGGGAEVPPLERFESIARRIEGLPGAFTDGEGQEAITVVSAQIKGPQNRSWPRPTTLDLRVAYLPSREGAENRDPQSIAASWSAPAVGGGTATREEHLSVGQLEDGYAATGRVLGVLEDSVQAVELRHASDAAEDGLRELMHRTFEGAVQAPPTEAAGLGRDAGPYIM